MPNSMARFLNSQSVALICCIPAPGLRDMVPRLRAASLGMTFSKVRHSCRSTKDKLVRALKSGAVKKPTAKKFSATLERMPGRLGWTIVRVPFDVARLWGSRGALRVRGEMNGFEF